MGKGTAEPLSLCMVMQDCPHRQGCPGQAQSSSECQRCLCLAGSLGSGHPARLVKKLY